MVYGTKSPECGYLVEHEVSLTRQLSLRSLAATQFWGGGLGFRTCGFGGYRGLGVKVMDLGVVSFGGLKSGFRI